MSVFLERCFATGHEIYTLSLHLKYLSVYQRTFVFSEYHVTFYQDFHSLIERNLLDFKCVYCLLKLWEFVCFYLCSMSICQFIKELVFQ